MDNQVVLSADGQQSEKSAVIYKSNDGTIQLEVQLYNDTVWLNRQQLSVLFDRDIKTIGKHIHNALDEELKGLSVVAKFATTAADGKVYQVEYYSLDVILSVGYRVKSAQGILFRRWANTVLKEYLLRGYSFNARMNQLEDKVDRRLAQHDQAIVDLKEKVDFFVQTKEPPLQSIFYKNKFWDAKSLLIKFIRRAKKELIVIDAYPDVATLDMLSKRRRGVKIELADLRSQNETAKTDVKEAA